MALVILSNYLGFGSNYIQPQEPKINDLTPLWRVWFFVCTEFAQNPKRTVKLLYCSIH